MKSNKPDVPIFYMLGVCSSGLPQIVVDDYFAHRICLLFVKTLFFRKFNQVMLITESVVKLGS